MNLVIALLIVVPLVLLPFTARTRFSRLPGNLVMICGALFLMFALSHDDASGMGALAIGVMTLAGIGTFVYGLVLYVIGTMLAPKHERRQPATLPMARTVAGVDKPE